MGDVEVEVEVDVSCGVSHLQSDSGSAPQIVFPDTLKTRKFRMPAKVSGNVWGKAGGYVGR